MIRDRIRIQHSIGNVLPSRRVQRYHMGKEWSLRYKPASSRIPDLSRGNCEVAPRDIWGRRRTLCYAHVPEWTAAVVRDVRLVPAGKTEGVCHIWEGMVGRKSWKSKKLKTHNVLLDTLWFDVQAFGQLVFVLSSVLREKLSTHQNGEYSWQNFSIVLQLNSVCFLSSRTFVGLTKFCNSYSLLVNTIGYFKTANAVGNIFWLFCSQNGLLVLLVSFCGKQLIFPSIQCALSRSEQSRCDNLSAKGNQWRHSWKLRNLFRRNLIDLIWCGMKNALWNIRTSQFMKAEESCSPEFDELNCLRQYDVFSSSFLNTICEKCCLVFLLNWELNRIVCWK